MNAPALEIDIGIAKTGKYAIRESGDTIELVERPSGGVSVVMIDGQGSGKAAKTLSLLLSSKAVTLLKEGVRDGVVARATHDFLFAYRHGQVSATFDLISFDLKTESVVITRNAEAPLLLATGGEISVCEPGTRPIGRYRLTRPKVIEYPIAEGFRAVLFTDGVPHSGQRNGREPFDWPALARDLLDDDRPAQETADALLATAVDRDSGRPRDDMAVLAVAVRRREEGIVIRRMQARVPIA